MGRYVEVDDLKKYVKSETAYDVDLYLAAIEAAEQFLDNATQRRIELAAVSASARSYRPDTQHSSHLWIHDCIGAPVVVEDGTTLTPNVDYVLYPINGLLPSGESRPFNAIERVGRAWYWDMERPTVTVTARWGWASIPAMARTACLIAAKSHLDSRDLKFGLVGATEISGITEREAKSVKDFVAQYRSHGSWGIA